MYQLDGQPAFLTESCPTAVTVSVPTVLDRYTLLIPSWEMTYVEDWSGQKRVSTRSPYWLFCMQTGCGCLFNCNRLCLFDSTCEYMTYDIANSNSLSK